MSMENVYTETIDDVVRLLAEIPFSDNTYFIGEQQPLSVVDRSNGRQEFLVFAKYTPELLDRRYASGRIFHRDFEVRWEKEGGKTRVVYVGNGEYCPSDLKFVEQVEMQPSRKYYLFGELLRPASLPKIGLSEEEIVFAEVRIPRLLRYPVDRPYRRVCLTVREAIDPEHGKVTLYRFQGVEPDVETAE